MANDWFQFKQFRIIQGRSAMKVTTDACLFGSWVAGLLAENSVGRFLDIGTGTGLLALMVAQKTRVHMDAVEVEEGAWEDANTNIKDSIFSERIHLVKTDIRFFETAYKYDFIISNPPFYENQLASGKKEKDIAHHSASLGFDDLVNITGRLLTPTGQFFFLLPYTRHEKFIRQLTSAGLHCHTIVHVKQTERHSYFRTMIAGSRLNGISTETDMLIMESGNEYSQQFKFLLKDYYLAL